MWPKMTAIDSKRPQIYFKTFQNLRSFPESETKWSEMTRNDLKKSNITNDPESDRKWL